MDQNRRDFIKTSTIAAMGAALFPSCYSDKEKGPEIGLQLYTIRDEMKQDPVGALRKVSEIGYQIIETAGYGQGQEYGYDPTEFRSIVTDLGLNPVSGHTPLQVFKESFDQALDFTLEIGREYMVLPYLSPQDRTSLDDYKKHANLLNQCAEKAAKSGVNICYHNHDFEFQFLEGSFPMDILMQELDPNLVNIELDLYWITRAGQDPITFFNQYQKRAPLWHVKDMNDTPKKGFTEVGTGTIDFGKIFSKADISGMKYFFVEQDISDNPMKSIEISFKNLRDNILNKS